MKEEHFRLNEIKPTTSRFNDFPRVIFQTNKIRTSKIGYNIVFVYYY